MIFYFGGLTLIIDECNIRRSIIKLSIPAVLEQTLFMVVGVISTIFVGHLSKEAISAVGLINVLFGFIMALFVALSTGATVLIARLIGEEEINSAKEAMRQSIILGTIASFLVTVICYIFAIPIINLFFRSADAEVIKIAGVYFRITLYTLPLTLINVIISGSLRGAGDTKTPMIIAYIVNAANVLLSFVLIFGINIFTVKFCGYGITGAAVAVSISRGIGGILSICVLFIPRSIIRVNIFEKFSINTNIVGRMLKIGIPAALEQLLMQGGFLILQVVISDMGTTAIAVFQIVMSVNSICFTPIWGFGIATTTIVGQCLGAKKPEIAEKCGWDTMKISLCIIVALTLVIYIFADKLMAIYIKDADVIRIGTAAIRIFSLSQPFLSAVVVFSGGLRGAGDIMYVTITSFIGIWGFRILFTIILNTTFKMGIHSVWIAYCMDFFIRSLMYLVRFKRGQWKHIVV